MSLRVLHVVHGFPPDSVGGTELHVRDLALAQADDHAVAVLTRVRRPETPDLTLVDEPPTGSVQVFGFNHLDRKGTSFLERTDFPPAERAFEAVVDRFRPEVVHVHHLSGLSAGVLATGAARGSRVVLTIWDHALACPRGQRIRLDLDPCPILDRDRCTRCVHPAWIEAARSPDRGRAIAGLFRPGEGARLFAVRDAHIHRQLDRVAAFIAPSLSASEMFLQYYPGARSRTTVIGHGLERGAEGAPAHARKQGAEFVAGYFGAILPSKGVGLLADVAARLSEENIRIVLNGAGSSRLIADLVRRGKGRLEFAGPYAPEDLGVRMAAVDAVLVPSLWAETFSIVTREAWAHRRPVLASETGALVEAAGPARNRVGLLPAGDVAAWTAAIRRLATDAGWYAQLAGPHEPESFDVMLRAIEACYMGRD